MLGLRHPFSRALYEQDGTGHVLVTTRDGRTGRFTPDGRWVDGEVRECDPHLCAWVAGRLMANHRMAEPTTDEARR